MSRRDPQHVRLFLLPLLLAAAGCGGGGSTPAESLVVESDAARKGRSDEDTNLMIVLSVTPGRVVAGGERGAGAPITTRGFVGFSLRDLPAGAQIESARLNWQFIALQGDPLRLLGDFFLQHIDMGPTLDAADVNAPPLPGTAPTSLLRQLMTPPELQQFTDVSLAVAADVAAGRDATCFRLQWQLALGESQVGRHGVELDAGLPGQRSAPRLEIQFRR